MQVHLIIALAATHLVLAATAVRAQPTQSPADCSQMTWQACAQIVTQGLRGATDDPGRAMRLVYRYWIPKFAAAYRALPTSQRARESDIEKLESELSGKINPVDYVRDEAITEAARQYLPRLAVALKFVGSAPIQGLNGVFWPSPTASGTQELIAANSQIHEALWRITNAKLKPDWKSSYTTILRDRIGPEFSPAPTTVP